MTAELLVIVPTRGRPHNVARLEEARRATASVAGADFLYAADDDDPELPAYKALGVDRLVIGPRRRLGPTLNDQARRHADLYPFLGFMGDDHLPVTPHWDNMVVGGLIDGNGYGGAANAVRPRIVYGNDLIQGQALPTAAFMHGRTVRALGFMSPPALVHLYIDNFWLELGRALDALVYLPHVVIQHMHPAGGTAAWDAGYADANAPARDETDRNAWNAFRRDDGPLGFAAAVERVERAYAR